jgi:hypothetical protein
MKLQPMSERVFLFYLFCHLWLPNPFSFVFDFKATRTTEPIKRLKDLNRTRSLALGHPWKSLIGLSRSSSSFCSHAKFHRSRATHERKHNNTPQSMWFINFVMLIA